MGSCSSCNDNGDIDSARQTVKQRTQHAHKKPHSEQVSSAAPPEAAPSQLMATKYPIWNPEAAAQLTTFACKIVPYEPALAESYRNKILVEIGILLKCNHPNLVKSYEVYSDGKFAFIVMDLLQRGNSEPTLDAYIKDNGPIASDKELATVIHRVAMGLKYLQQHCHLVLRDLKPANVTSSLIVPLPVSSSRVATGARRQ